MPPIRTAISDDLPAITRLLEAVGLPLEGVDDGVGEAYCVAEAREGLIGAAGCEVHGDLGLLRSVVVQPDHRGTGLGRRLVEHRLAWARSRGLRDVYLLTTDAAGYFEGRGFVSIERSATPDEIRRCSEFASVCPESATVMRLPLSAASTPDSRTDQRRRAARFRALHVSPPILVLPNVWDVVSARLYETEGFEAVGTTSAGISAVLGLPDGQRISLDDNVAAVRRICDRTGLLVSADIEAGYSDSPEGVIKAAAVVIDAGAVGLNLEDGTGDAARPLETASLVQEKIRAIRQAASSAGVPLVINARTDVFLTSAGEAKVLLEETRKRAAAYREAGADCVFVPDVSGALDAETIGILAEEIPAPLNVIAGSGTPSIADLEALGVARVSFGPRAMRAALSLVRTMAREWRDSGTYSTMLRDALSYDDVNRMLDR